MNRRIRRQMAALEKAAAAATALTPKPVAAVVSQSSTQPAAPARKEVTKVIFFSDLSPGDFLMLSAAIRDLKKAAPALQIDIRTPSPDLFKHNPHLTPLDDKDPAVVKIKAEYPLIHASNYKPFHFIHGFRMWMEDVFNTKIPQGDFHGEVFLSVEEKTRPCLLEEEYGWKDNFWLVVAGGKDDYTCKWWEHDRYQQVVNRFNGKIKFVQIGDLHKKVAPNDNNHLHRPLENVIDLRGKTTLRELIRLMFHAQGVLCPVTFPMHLAAACPTRFALPYRPCVVVAGSRESASWEAYPTHRYLHNCGSLSCSLPLGTGCWRSRVVPLNDGSDKDKDLCLLPILTPSGQYIPKCLDMITVDHVVDAIHSYFAAGPGVSPFGPYLDGSWEKP